MDTNRLRSLLAVMTKGETIVVPHVEEHIECFFDAAGLFNFTVSSKQISGTGIKSTKSLKEAVEFLMYWFEPKIDHVYQHLNGNIYTVIAIANQQSLRPEYPPTVVYKGSNGLVWAKPLANFIRKMTRIK